MAKHNRPDRYPRAGTSGLRGCREALKKPALVVGSSRGSPEYLRRRGTSDNRCSAMLPASLIQIYPFSSRQCQSIPSIDAAIFPTSTRLQHTVPLLILPSTSLHGPDAQLIASNQRPRVRAPDKQLAQRLPERSGYALLEFSSIGVSGPYFRRTIQIPPLLLFTRTTLFAPPNTPSSTRKFSASTTQKTKC